MRANLHIPEGVDGPPLVLVAHGFKGFKDWGFFPWLAESLAKAGIAALRFDFAGNGVGDAPETFERLDLFRENSISAEVSDLADILAALPGLPGLLGVDLGRLGLFGHSRGGGEAILFAASEPRIRSLVTWASVARFERYFSEEALREWASAGVFFIPNSRTGQDMPLGMNLYHDLTAGLADLDVVAAEADLAVPHLVLHGTADETVPVSDAHALFTASKGRAELHLVDGAGHTFGAAHPFAGSTPHLDEAAGATSRHFLRTL